MWPRALNYIGLIGLLAAASATGRDLVYITNFGQTSAVRMSGAPLQRYRNDADKYALASHIKVLRPQDPDEVRLWVSWATFDPSTNGIGTVGYIVTAKRSERCLISYPGRSTEPKKGVCRRYAPRESAERIMANITHLSSFANFAITCRVLDGDWVLIDAVSKGKRFVLWADNPQSCRGGGARLVSRLLDAVTERSR